MKPTSPIEILTHELTDAARLAATVRYLLKKRSLQITRAMKLDPNTLATASEELLAIGAAMTATVTAISKLLLGPKGPGTGDDSTTAEKALEAFVRGEKPKL